MPRWNARVDANQQQIIDTLRKAGCTVLDLHRVGQGCPDLLVGYRGKDGVKRNYLFEVKQEHRDLNVPEMDFFLQWRGQVTVIRNADQALDLIMDDGDE